MVSVKKETLNYFIGTALLAILNFAVSILYGDMFSPEDYGAYSLAFATYSLLSQMVVGWVSMSLIRYYIVHKKAGTDHKLISSVFVQHIVFSILQFILILISVQFIPLSAELKTFAIIFSIFFFFESYVLFINTLMRIDNNSKQYNINININCLLKIGILLLFYYVFGLKAVYVIALSLLCAEIIQTVYLTIKFKFYKYFTFKQFSSKILLQLFKYGAPLIGASISNWILNVSDRYVINFFYSDYDVGLYSYSYSLASSIISLLSQFIMLGAYPNIIKMWEEYGKEKTVALIKKYLTLYILIILPVCFGFLCMGERFFLLFTNERYWSSYMNFIITGFGIAVLGFNSYASKVWELKKKTGTTLILNAVAAVLNIVLNFWLIPKFGYIMGSVTTLVSYVVYLLLSVLLGRKYLRLQVDWPKVLKIGVASLMMMIALLLMNNLPLLNNFAGFLLECTVGVLVYIFAISILKVVDFSDLKKMFIR